MALVCLMQNPKVSDLLSLIPKHTSSRDFVLLIANCSVEYVGRARSKMGPGERLLIIKPDHTILVHRRSGRDPTNWQPPGSQIKAEACEDGLAIRFVRRSPPEELRLMLHTASLFAALHLVDRAPFDMMLTEEELYSIILENPELIEPGLRLLDQQKETKAGVIDLVARDCEGRYVVIEVKRNPANGSAVKQLYRYVAEIRGSRGQVRGILAAPAIGAAPRRLLSSLGLEFRHLNLKKCAELLAQRERSKNGLNSHIVGQS